MLRLAVAADIVCPITGILCKRFLTDMFADAPYFNPTACEIFPYVSCCNCAIFRNSSGELLFALFFNPTNDNNFPTGPPNASGRKFLFT